ncbi:Gibberellin 20 oxidase 1-D [Dendrobium catenatum]|uniref:Gibberellin 20 oxidase 1-D n=1 Tax=Dendrobium catenatum TaxID=906689 RepID=A0A2I0VUX8_9ASPA|nr:Gibberellin 20 oxidase 1-D [Dendrobium catenatum]
MAGSLQLPLVDLFSADRAAAVQSIREACLEYGFFYIKNHGIDREIQLVFRESEKFFSLPFDEKMKLQRNDDHRGYTPPYAENLDPSSKSKGETGLHAKQAEKSASPVRSAQATESKESDLEGILRDLRGEFECRDCLGISF